MRVSKQDYLNPIGLWTCLDTVDCFFFFTIIFFLFIEDFCRTVLIALNNEEKWSPKVGSTIPSLGPQAVQRVEKTEQACRLHAVTPDSGCAVTTHPKLLLL